MDGKHGAEWDVVTAANYGVVAAGDHGAAFTE